MTDTSGSPKGVEDDLWSKPDETINEKIKDLCPIVITTIDCRPTKFKDGDDVLTVTSRDGVVLTVIDKDGNERPRSALRNATGGTTSKTPGPSVDSGTTTRPRKMPWSTTSNR